jgi:hypothetical protein
MHTPTGRLYARLKAQALAERDIENFGPIVRTDEELLARVRYHMAEIERSKPTPEAVVTDDLVAFTTAIQEGYLKAYNGLMVGYTGLNEPYRLKSEPRYTTSIIKVDTESEHPFCGLGELLALLKHIQDHYREEEQDPLSLIQVSIIDAQDVLTRPHWIAYDVEGDSLIGVRESPPGWDDILLGLGLPLASDFEEEAEQKEKTMKPDHSYGKDSL